MEKQSKLAAFLIFMGSLIHRYERKEKRRKSAGGNHRQN